MLGLKTEAVSSKEKSDLNFAHQEPVGKMALSGQLVLTAQIREPEFNCALPPYTLPGWCPTARENKLLLVASCA